MSDVESALHEVECFISYSAYVASDGLCIAGNIPDFDTYTDPESFQNREILVLAAGFDKFRPGLGLIW